MREKWLRVVVGVCIVLFFSACSEKEVPQSSKVSRTIVNTLPSDFLLEFPKTRIRYVNSLKEARVVVINPMEKPCIGVEYRFKWYDKRKREVAENFSVWQPLFIEAKDQKEIIALAPTPEAKRFKFYIRKREK